MHFLSHLHRHPSVNGVVKRSEILSWLLSLVKLCIFCGGECTFPPPFIIHPKKKATQIDVHRGTTSSPHGVLLRLHGGWRQLRRGVWVALVVAGKQLRVV